MSASITVGELRMWRHDQTLIQVLDLRTEGEYAGNYLFRSLADQTEGLLPAETLLRSTASVTVSPTNSSDDTPSLVALDAREAATQAIRGVLYTTPYADLGWRPDPGRFATDDEASEHLARLIAEWVTS